MRFTLTYDGPLNIRGGAKAKQKVRDQLHPQLLQLWQYPPLANATAMLTPHGWLPGPPGQKGTSVLTDVKGRVFASLVCRALRLTAELEVLLLRPGRPGVLTGQGDIDNRLKVLFDGLSVPDQQMLSQASCPAGLGTEDAPFHTLLEDDDLVTRVDVDTARLLGAWDEDMVRAIIRVNTRPSDVTVANVPML